MIICHFILVTVTVSSGHPVQNPPSIATSIAIALCGSVKCSLGTVIQASIPNPPLPDLQCREIVFVILLVWSL